MTGRFLFLTLTIYQIRINGSQGSGKKDTKNDKTIEHLPQPSIVLHHYFVR